MDRYGYFGEVSYRGQNRFRPYSALTGLTGLSAVPRAVPSGDYRGALGKIVRNDMYTRPSRLNDLAVFRGLGITPAGLGATDREVCSTLLNTAGQLTTAVGTAAAGSRPTRRSGESTSSYESRLRTWETSTRTTGGAGAGLSTVSALCNLINEAETPTGGASGQTTNDWELMRARAELQRMYAQQAPQSSGISTNTLLLVGGVGIAAVAAYVLLSR